VQQQSPGLGGQARVQGERPGGNVRRYRPKRCGRGLTAAPKLSSAADADHWPGSADGHGLKISGFAHWNAVRSCICKILHYICGPTVTALR